MAHLVTAVVVAAGSGTRLGGKTPKALRRLAGKPLVRYAVDELSAGGCDHVVVVIPESDRESFRAALADVRPAVELVAGGSSRQDSVARGLSRVASPYVLVHDAARPLAPRTVVAAVIAELTGGADCVIPVLPVVDSIRSVTPTGDSRPVDRLNLRVVQTPQGFQTDVLREAHEKLAELQVQVTDDASAVELIGAHVRLISGSELALKVTRPIDLVVAEQLLKEA